MKREPITSVSAFSLTELLVAMTIFVLIVTLTAQIVGQTATVTTLRTKHIGALTTARATFDALERDLGNVVTQGDASLVGGIHNGNSRLTLLCRSRPNAANAGERMSLVCYHVRGTADNPLGTLCRDTQSVAWESEDYSFDALLSLTPFPGNESAIPDGVLAFNVAWLRRDGSLKQITDEIPVDIDEIRGFIVTIATLDTLTLKALVHLSDKSESLSPTLAAAFPAPSDNELPARRWRTGVAALPDSRLRENIRVMQRTYYLPKGDLK